MLVSRMYNLLDLAMIDSNPSSNRHIIHLSRVPNIKSLPNLHLIKISTAVEVSSRKDRYEGERFPMVVFVFHLCVVPEDSAFASVLDEALFASLLSLFAVNIVEHYTVDTASVVVAEAVVGNLETERVFVETDKVVVVSVAVGIDMVEEAHMEDTVAVVVLEEDASIAAGIVAQELDKCWEVEDWGSAAEQDGYEVVSDMERRVLETARVQGEVEVERPAHWLCLVDGNCPVVEVEEVVECTSEAGG